MRSTTKEQRILQRDRWTCTWEFVSRKRGSAITAKEQLESFLSRYSPEIAILARRALSKMRKRLPGAVEMVYDNYNALVSGFGPTERPSEAIFSIVLYPRYVILCFLQGAGLSDPSRRLQGSGNLVRHIRLQTAETLDDPAVNRLIAKALLRAKVPIYPGKQRQLIIKSVSAKQRPRRPVAKKR